MDAVGFRLKTINGDHKSHPRWVHSGVRQTPQPPKMRISGTRRTVVKLFCGLSLTTNEVLHVTIHTRAISVLFRPNQCSLRACPAHPAPELTLSLCLLQWYPCNQTHSLYINPRLLPTLAGSQNSIVTSTIQE